MSSLSGGAPPSDSRKTTIWPLLLVLLLLGLALFGDKGILRAIQFNRQKASLQAELQRIEKINAELRQEIKSLRTDRRYIEDIARRELGMVKPDELVYQFPAQGTEKSTAKEDMTDVLSPSEK